MKKTPFCAVNHPALIVLLLVLVAPALVAQEKALISMGEFLDLQLLHHVSSKHPPHGGWIYFKVPLAPRHLAHLTIRRTTALPEIALALDLLIGYQLV